VTNQEQLIAFLDQHITFPRAPGPYATALYAMSWRTGAPRPTAEELAQQLLALAEFRALQLGTWLSTPDGQFLTETVEMVTPPFYRADLELLIDALQIAAREQQHRERRNLALGVAVFAMIAIVIGATAD
jgi:hypothetical protein